MLIEQIGRSGQPRRELRTLAGIAAPEPPDAVAESVVPLGETGRMMAELVAARADVPWLGDQLDPRQNRILPQRVEKAGAGIEAIGFAAQASRRDRSGSRRRGTTSTQ